MINHQNLQISASTPVMEAMHIIDDGAAQIALVVDDQQHLLGTLTDGDIRRGFLQGKTFETPVEQMMNRNFRFARCCDDQSLVLKMMRRDALRQIPILDEHGRIVNLLLLQELLNPDQISNSVVIMAGGKGTRLRPFTQHCPKPMLDIDGQPMLEILLKKFISNGFYNFFFSVNYLKEQIVDYFEDGSRWGVDISYLEESMPLGTAGSLSLLPKDINAPFLVMNGDVMTQLNPVQLLRFHHEHKADATLCVRNYSIEVPFGVVQTGPDAVELLSFDEKPVYKQLVNTGIYVINPSLLSLLEPNEFTDMPTLLQSARQSGFKVVVCPIHEYWLDVGNPNSLEAARQEYQS